MNRLWLEGCDRGWKGQGDIDSEDVKGLESLLVG